MNVLATGWFFIYVINSLSEPSLITNFLAFTFWLVTVVYLFKTQVQLSFFNFMAVFAYTTTGLSCLVAELGSYYAETRAASFLTGATSRNLSLSFFLLYGVYLGFSFIKKYLPTTYPKIQTLNLVVSKLIILLAVIIIICLLYINFKYGMPND